MNRIFDIKEPIKRTKSNPVGRCCRICPLYLCRGVKLYQLMSYSPVS